MRDKHRRAWLHTTSPDLFHAVLPALALAIGTAAATCYWLRDNEEFRTSDVIFPTLAGLGIFFLALLAIHGGEYAYRLVSGKAPSGSRRTLAGIDTTAIEQTLAATLLPGVHNLKTYSPNKEVEDFARELAGLLEKAGYELDCDYGLQWDRYDGPTIRDVVIRQPGQDNRGLTALGQFLNQYGYRCTFQRAGSSGSQTANILIGEATH